MRFSYAAVILIFLALIFFVPQHAGAQEGTPLFQTYQHESGLGYHIFEALNAEIQNDFPRHPPYWGFMAISYGGRVTPKSFGSEAGVSINAKGALALTLSSFGSYFVINLPVTAEFNAGHAATVESVSDIGGFFGAGVDFNYVHIQGYAGSPYFVGPIITGGARFYLRNTSNTIRLSQSYDITGNGGVVLVISLTTNIGE